MKLSYKEFEQGCYGKVTTRAEKLAWREECIGNGDYSADSTTGEKYGPPWCPAMIGMYYPLRRGAPRTHVVEGIDYLEKTVHLEPL